MEQYLSKTKFYEFYYFIVNIICQKSKEMSSYQKCRRRTYCQEQCCVHPKTKKLMTMCQYHWDLVKQNRQKRKNESANSRIAIKRPKVDYRSDGLRPQIEIECIQYKEHRRTEKISENEEIIYITRTI